jgi:hypothetical protein
MTVKELLDRVNFLLKEDLIKENDTVVFGSNQGSFATINVGYPKVVPNDKTLQNNGLILFCDNK